VGEGKDWHCDRLRRLKSNGQCLPLCQTRSLLLAAFIHVVAGSLHPTHCSYYLPTS
jgi:hypothetical protein